MKTFRRILPVVIWALLLLPFFLGAQAAHPATDDFTFAVYTHPTWESTHSVVHVIKDAISYALRTWRDWQGTVTGVIIMALNPAVFSIETYGVHAVILLVMNLTSWFVFIRHMLKTRMGMPRRIWLGVYLALSASLLMFLPDIVEGIYWFNGAWFYMGAQAAALITLVLCDRFAVSESGRGRQALSALLCSGLLFALGMDNYITAMMTAAALFMMALQRLWAKEKRTALRTALLLVPIGAGLLISVIAPGNSVRMAADGAHQSGPVWLVSSILWTLRDAAKYVVRFCMKTPLLALLLGMTPAVCGALGEREAPRRCPPAALTLLGAYLILCAMIIPHMYSSGYAGSGRVVNMYHCYVLIAAPLVLVMALMRVNPQRRAALAKRKKIFGVLGAAAFVLCILGGQLGNYQKLVSDQMDGTQETYMAQFKHEYALCETAGAEDDVILPVWTVQTVTGKPTAYADETVWTNESMAQYFGVKSVKTAE